MMDDYANRQVDHERTYVASFDSPEYLRWVNSLSSEERQHAESLGLLKPMIDRSGSISQDEDAAESSAASVGAPHVLSSDSLDAVLADYPHLEAAIEERARKKFGDANGGEMFRELALLFIDQGRRALNADCLAYVTGLAFRMGESGTSLARKHGITRQAFQKRCVDLMNQLGLPPSRAMKSKNARESYRASNRRWNNGRPVNRTTSVN
jgi:hypothetical protein